MSEWLSVLWSGASPALSAGALVSAASPASAAAVASVVSVASVASEGSGNWELSMRPGWDAQPILEACFANQIRLRRFNTIEPTLHDVFVNLVGPGAREAVHR